MRCAPPEKFNCEDHYDGFVRPDRCKVEGELTADLGFGEHGFEVLPDGELPPIHLGSQGGMHVFMALRIFGADLTQYDTIRVHFAFTQKLASGDCAGGARGTGGQECALIQGKRDLVLGAKQPITVLADGTIEEHGDDLHPWKAIIFADPTLWKVTCNAAHVEITSNAP